MRFVGNKRGQGLVEYLIIVALMAVASIAIMQVVGQSVSVKFAKIAEALGAKVDGKIQSAVIYESYTKKKSLKNFMNGSLPPKSSKNSGQTDEAEELDTDTNAGPVPSTGP